MFSFAALKFPWHHRVLLVLKSLIGVTRWWSSPWFGKLRNLRFSLTYILAFWLNAKTDLQFAKRDTVRSKWQSQAIVLPTSKKYSTTLWAPLATATPNDVILSSVCRAMSPSCSTWGVSTCHQFFPLKVIIDIEEPADNCKCFQVP